MLFSVLELWLAASPMLRQRSKPAFFPKSSHRSRCTKRFTLGDRGFVGSRMAFFRDQWNHGIQRAEKGRSTFCCQWLVRA